MMARLKNQVAIISGGANGLGRAISERFAGEGAKLMLGDIETEALGSHADRLRAQGAEVETHCGDLTDETSVKSMVDTTISRFGQIDILVNNLGGNRPGRIWEVDVETWDFVIRLNLRSLFLCTRYVTAHMVERRQGKIICLSSGAREGTPWSAYYSGGSAYSAAKAGVHGFMRDVAMELAEYNIRVNAIAPGPIDTDRVGPGLRELNETVELSPNKMTPHGRLGTPREIADAALFLASDESTYVTGHTLAVTGGR